MSIKRKLQRSHKDKKLIAEANEMAMIGGIMEGSPEAIGVVIIRLECGCRKMAAVDKKGDPASKVIIYRDNALNICDKCKEDNGAFARVTEQFIHWEDEPDGATKRKIVEKVLGNVTVH
ncbi:MAG: hypothetical protein ABFR97_07765 [Thermodesulfobacteriota bacterium]